MTKNPDSVYSIVCRVTLKELPTNPAQFKKLCERFQLNSYEMENSYLSQEGKRILKKAQVTPQEAADQYNLHINVANSLYGSVKKKPIVVESTCDNHCVGCCGE